jgi:Collagen triple helix repeat (20 copies)
MVRAWNGICGAVRRRVSGAGVIATVALVFAMSGGAYAANRYLITSTKQISPKVLKSLKGAAGAKGANGAAGAQGAAGPAGPTGAQGAAGAKGENGTNGIDGTDGKEGALGKEGSPWTAGGTLPSGKTETGAWSASQESLEYGSPVAVSFTIPLAEGLDAAHVHFQPSAGETQKIEEFEATCPGSAEAPKATPGNFCVYAGSLRHLAFESIIAPSSPGNDLGTGTSGAIIRMAAEGEAEQPAPAATAWGDWAVTAP